MYTMYTFHSNSRDYNDWFCEPQITSFEPIKHKLFSNDVFLYENNILKIITSYTREYKHHTGVLMLHGNKTYGKTKKNKMYYKCIPDDKTLPIFLIPYELRIGFSKDHLNKYVSFSFDNWEQKHPIGILTETFGDVDNFSSFCSYQLWSKKLVHSISNFNRECKNFFKQTSEESFIQKLNEYKMKDHTNKYVFSIDPQGSKDLDDAICIEQLSDSKYEITVYIANVVAVLDVLQMWSSLSNRVSTIYLPENRNTMLPEILSDTYCSLLENQARPSFAMSIVYNEDSQSFEEPHFFNALIYVKRNFVYDEQSLLDDKNYILLKKITTKIEKNEKIDNSHDVVSFWMITMNSYAANKLKKYKSGVYRVVTKNTMGVGEMKETIQLWNSYSGSYQLYSNENLRHDSLNIDCYAHITSPIRRLVDIMNQIYFFIEIFDIQLKIDNCFIEDLQNRIVQLNIDMKNIRKVQSECDLLYFCKNDSNALTNVYDGYILNKNIEKDFFIYNVYIKALNKISFFKSQEDLEQKTSAQFKLYLFDRENNGHRKIRLALA